MPKVTKEPRVFTVRISDEFAEKDWDNEANDLVAEFREWLTGVKDDAQRVKQTSEDDGGGEAQSFDPETPGDSEDGG